MKTIKFRGKHIGDGEWVYGSLLQEQISGCTTESIIVDRGFGREYKQAQVGTVGQFTGKTDCDKKEIYEGDILIEPSVATIPLEVRYNEKQCAFCLIEHTHTEGPLLGTCPLGDMLRQYPSMKVVGNIHDNPDNDTHRSKNRDDHLHRPTHCRPPAQPGNPGVRWSA